MTEAEWLAGDNPAAMLTWMIGRDTPPGDRKLRLFACACCRAVWHLLTDPRSRAAVEVAERYADGEVTERERQAAYEVLPRSGDQNWSTSGAALVIHCLMPNGLRQEGPLGELLNNSVEVCPECDGDGELVTSHRSTCYTCRGSGLVCGTGKGLLPYPAQAALLRDIVGNPWRPVALPKCQRCDGGGERIGSDRPFEYMPDAAVALRCPDCNGIGHVFGTPTVTLLAQAAYEERSDSGTLDPLRLAVLADALEEAGCSSDDLLFHLRTPGPHVRGCWAVDAILGKE